MLHTVHRIILAVLATVLISLPTGSAAGVPAPQKANSLRQREVMELLQSGTASRQVSKTIDDRGIDFDLTPAVEREVRRAGGTDDVVAALKRASQRRSESAKPRKTPAADHEATTPGSSLPIPNAKLSPVQFYEGPVDQTLEKSQREYRCSFDRFTTRAVYWELDLSYPPPGRRVDFQFDIVWYKPDGTEMDRQTVSAYVLPDWGSSWETLGFGYREPGHWLPGTYRIEIFFRNTHVADGTFQIN